MNAILPVRAFTDPIRGIAGPPIEFERPERATLADIIALVPLENEALRPHLRVKLGGVLIDPSLYHRVLPKQDAFLTVVLPVHDDGNLLGTIAAVALIGASLVVSAGLAAPLLGTAFAAGSVGASLLAGGLSLAASLLLQGLTPPQQKASASKEVGVASAQNAFEPGAYLQRVMGTRRVTPQMVMPPYTEVVADDQFVTAVYGLAGPHLIENISLGTAKIDSASDVQYEVRAGTAADAALTLVTNTVIEEGSAIKLSDFVIVDNGYGLDSTVSPNTPFWHRVETRKDPDRFTINFAFDRGLGLLSDGRAVTAIRVRMRAKGAVSWINLPEFVINGRQAGSPLRLMLNLLWTAPGSMPGTVTPDASGSGPTPNGWFRKYNSVVPSAGPTWTADSYFSGSVINWRDRQNYDVYLSTSTFPKGGYEFEVIRGYTVATSEFNASSHAISGSHADVNDFFQSAPNGSNLEVATDQAQYARSLIISSVQSVWNEYPFDLTNQPTALIAVKARNRSIDQLSCIASGCTEDWNGSTWAADQTTKNPASWYREVLTGPYNAEPVPATLVDMANLQDWHEWCAARGHEVNAVVQGQPVTEVLSIIAQAGFARPRYAATHGVVIDRPRSPVGLITQRNASGFSFQKPFGRLPHALKVNLADEDNRNEVRELIVFADGYAATAGAGLLEATRFESITYPGITDEAQATERAKLDLRWGRYRSRLIPFTMDIEHLEYQLGDLVLLETDILGQVGGRGRVSSIETSGGLITGLVLDEQRDFTAADASGAMRGVTIRLADGTLRTERVTADDTNLNRVVFQTPFAMPTSGADDLIEAGTLVVSGTFEQEARKVLIWDMAPGPDLTCQITAIDYAEVNVYGTYTLAAAKGLITISGQAASITFTGRSVISAQGSLTITGQAAGFVRALQLVAGQGNLAVSGQGANFLRALRPLADQGSYTISGQAAGFLMGRQLVAGQGSLALSGQAANFARSLMLGASVGTLAISGQSASFALGKSLVADVGSFALSGQNAAFVRALRLAADQGSFALNGQAANLLSSRMFAAGAGAFALSGQAATIVPPSGVTSLTFVASATSTGSTITVPATAQAGDIALLIDNARGSTAPAQVIPTGWTAAADTAPSTTRRATTSYKVLSGGDVGATVTGMSGGTDNSKVMLVFRPNAAISTVTPSTWNTPAQTNSDPPSQAVNASGQTTPLIIIGSAAVGAPGTPAFNASTTPAFDASVATGRVIVGYKIYNSSPANHTIDMDDLGNENTLQTGYVAIA